MKFHLFTTEFKRDKEENVLAGAHKQLEYDQHSEMRLIGLKVHEKA